MADGVPTLIVDGGNLGDDPGKRAVIVEAMAKTGYAACLAGAGEAEALAKAFESEPGSAEVVAPFDPAQPMSAFWIGETEGARVALTRIDPEAIAGNAGWQEALERVAIQARKQSDLVVLISGLSPDGTLSLARRLGPTGSVQAIVVGPGTASAGLPTKEAGVLLCSTRDRGQAITVLDAVYGEDQRWAVTSHLEPVTTAYPPESAIQALVNAHYGRRQTALAAGSLEPSLSEAAYAPARSCKPCHEKAYQVWRKSAHAKAVETLRQKGRLVPECLGCHSEQHRRAGRLTPQEDGENDGVQCSTCHGDGIVHTLTRGGQKLTERLACAECHDAEHDRRFSIEDALQAIAH